MCITVWAIGTPPFYRIALWICIPFCFACLAFALLSCNNYFVQFVYSYFSKQCELSHFWNGTCRAKLEVCSRFGFIAFDSDLYLSTVRTLPNVALLILGQYCIYDEHRSLHTKCRGNFRGYRRPLRATLSDKIRWREIKNDYYNDVTMGAIASQITSLTIVY